MTSLLAFPCQNLPRHVLSRDGSCCGLTGPRDGPTDAYLKGLMALPALPIAWPCIGLSGLRRPTPGGQVPWGVAGISSIALTRDGDLGTVNRLWPCLAGVFGWFDGFYGRGGRSALYILAAEHDLMGPWPGWCGMGGLSGGGA